MDAGRADGASEADHEQQGASEGDHEHAAAREADGEHEAEPVALASEPEHRRTGRPPVMSDVGRLAGVSHQTVSRVINGSAQVRPETRARVLAAMRELGYRPNSIARALVTGRTGTLGVVSFDTTLYGPASMLFGIERAAHEAGYFIVIASLKAMDRPSVTEAARRLQGEGVEGILAIVSESAQAEALLDLPLDVPLVAAEAGPDQGLPVIAVDQVAGARMAVEHLLGLGHDTVWHVTGPLVSLEAVWRVQGWQAALEAARAPAPEPLHGDWSARAGYGAGRQLARDPDVTAVFVANDQMSLGVLRALHEAERPIPDSMSVVGFDDIPEAPYFTPPLTTVRQDFGEVGSRALRVLVAAIESPLTGAEVPERTLVMPRLIVRKSTGRHRAGRPRRRRAR